MGETKFSAMRLLCFLPSRSLQIAWLTVACAVGALTGQTAGREVQSHGLRFEKWLRDTFFGGYQPEDYTQKWDIPARANPDHGGIPVNPKAAKYGTAIGLGDALRQFTIAEQSTSFMLIVGFWDQVEPDRKRWVNVQTVKVTPARWRKLWGAVTRQDLEALVAVVKDKRLSLEEARSRVKEIKSAPPFSESVIQVNAKIDRSQRRLQCSLRFDDFFTHLASQADPGKSLHPSVFGVRIPETVHSPPRRFAP